MILLNLGTLDALDKTWLITRPTTDNLKPYLCNLLVAPMYRKKGYGRKLLKVELNLNT